MEDRERMTGETPNPLDVLRFYAVTSVDGKPTRYDIALAHVEALAEAAQALAGGMIELRTLPGCVGTIDADSLVALRVALVPFAVKGDT